MEDEAYWQPHAQRYSTLWRFARNAHNDAEKVHVGVTSSLAPSSRRLTEAAIPPLILLLHIVKVLLYRCRSLFLILMKLLLYRWIFEICRVVLGEPIIHVSNFWFWLYNLIFLITDQFFIRYIIDLSLSGTISIWAVNRISCWTVILGILGWLLMTLTTGSRHGRLLKRISHVSITHPCRWSVLYSQLTCRSWVFWIHTIFC